MARTQTELEYRQMRQALQQREVGKCLGDAMLDNACAADPRDYPIESAVVEQNTLLDRLDNALSQLENKLASILTPVDHASSGQSDAKAILASVLASRLNGHNAALRVAIDRVDRLRTFAEIS